MDYQSVLLQHMDQIVSDEDKVLFQEAVNSVRVDSYRAAYIMIWLSCAESLKRRFRELSLRDKRAAKVAGEVSRREADHKAIDAYLLQEAKDYGIVSDVDHTRLNHVYQLRCVFGHPYEKQPSIEELIAASENVISIVLSQPVKLRHGYIESQVRLLVEDETFLDDFQPTVEVYTRDIFTKVDNSLHDWLLRKLLSKLEPLAPDPTMALFIRRGVWFATEYAKLMASIANQKWDAVPLITDFPSLTADIFVHPTTFKNITSHSQDIIIGNLLILCKESSSHLTLLSRLHDSGQLNERQMERCIEKIQNLPLIYLSSVGVHPMHFAHKIIEALRSHNWYVQNPAIVTLRRMGVERLTLLSTDIQIILGNNLLQTAEGGEREAINWLSQLHSEISSYPTAFVEGILTECFVNERGEMRFKITRLTEVMMILMQLPHVSRIEIVTRVVQKINSYPPKYSYSFLRDKETSVNTLEKFITEDNKSVEDIVNLKNSIEALEEPD